MAAAMWACLALAACGLGVVVVTLARARRLAPDFDEFFEELDFADERQSLLAQPLLSRTVGGSARQLAARLEGLLPRNYIANVDHQLAQAGRTGKRRTGEQVALQLLLAAVGAGLAPFLPTGSPMTGALAYVLLPVMGFMLPAVRLKRAIRTRSEAIFKDLPDIVDMLAIAVEAGSGFESAIATVCTNFDSPLTDELLLALQGMELGLPRRQALQELRDRVDIDVVRNLMLALLQADALGIPIGRVLKAQATEVRARRRAWAREKAGKLPVKIMFPLVLFIFPPIMALVLGPAAFTFGQLSS
jgi:tight adherence protein C